MVKTSAIHATAHLLRTSPQLDSRPVKVLMVQDSARCHVFRELLLCCPEYRFHWARTSQEALEILRVEEFDAVLLDQCVGTWDAMELCRRIRGELELPFLPVLAIMSKPGLSDLKMVLEAGASDVIPQQCDTVELSARVNAAVAGKRMADQLDDVYSILSVLARLVEARTRGQAQHCDRLAHYGALFGTVLGLSSLEIQTLRRGAVLHDIGKLAVPDSILLKPGDLDANEWGILKAHTTAGARLLEGLHSMERVAPIVRSHHERWDGGGYPDGLVGTQIPYMARVFQMVDIYEALSNSRTFRPAYSAPQIIHVMEEEAASGKRDPELTERFIDLLHEFPQGLRNDAAVPMSADRRILEDILDTGVFA